MGRCPGIAVCGLRPTVVSTADDRSGVKTGALEGEGSWSGLAAGLSFEKALSLAGLDAEVECTGRIFRLVV